MENEDVLNKRMSKEEELKRIIEIRQELEQLLQKHGKFMSIKGAGTYWAMQKLESAIGYLKEEEEIIEKVFIKGGE